MPPVEGLVPARVRDDTLRTGLQRLSVARPSTEERGAPLRQVASLAVDAARIGVLGVGPTSGQPSVLG